MLLWQIKKSTLLHCPDAVVTVDALTKEPTDDNTGQWMIKTDC